MHIQHDINITEGQTLLQGISLADNSQACLWLADRARVLTPHLHDNWDGTSGGR